MGGNLLRNVVITADKLTKYLLVYKDKRDKSKYLQQAGYTIENWQTLEKDLRLSLKNGKIIFEEENEYGRKYSVRSLLVGPNGKGINVKTIWMYDRRKEQTIFITLYPDKK